MKCPHCRKDIDVVVRSAQDDAELLHGVRLKAGERLPLPRYLLTQREYEVAAFITQGARHKEIALALGTSEQTVKNCAKNVYDKLGCDNRVDLCLRYTVPPEPEAPVQ